jgi:hypothetical protein
MAKPKQYELPEIERKMKDLHEAALEYADIRDRRQELTVEEVAAKTKLLDLMHKHKKEEYEYEGVSIRVVHEEETVKVRVRKVEEEESDAA